MSSPSKTTVDWLRFRTQGTPLEVLGAMRALFGQAGHLLTFEPLPRGSDGFEQACALSLGGLVLGRVDFGGDAMRGWVRVNLTGKGCQWVEATDHAWDDLEAVEGLPQAEIRRLDIALTTWQGEVTHECVEAAHASGLFCSGGRPPELQMVTGSNPRAGRTCYVGKRDSDKFFRGYEKGFELAGKLGAMGQSMTHVDGYPIEDIYRCEVELKADGRVVPFEVVERRDHYFAGCYPFLAELLPDIGCDILMRRPERAPRLELQAALANCRQQYGAAIFTALAAYKGDIFRVWDQIKGDEHHAGLLAAGVLAVDHD